MRNVFENEAIISSSHITQCKRTPDGRVYLMITKRAFIRENPLLILSYSVENNFANKCINPRLHNTHNIMSPYIYTNQNRMARIGDWISNLMIPGTKDQLGIQNEVPQWLFRPYADTEYTSSGQINDFRPDTAPRTYPTSPGS